MGETTAIKWTDHTFNGWWGCVKISPACANCYAATFAKRTGHAIWGKDAPRRFFGDKHWREPLAWAKKAEAEGVRRRVFCSSMADVFEDYEGLDEQRARLWALIEATPALDWQLLTKRPENIRRMVPDDWLHEPRPNVWLGTTAETQEWADKRIPALLQTPAAVRFISAEPLLGPIDLTDINPARDETPDHLDALRGIVRTSYPTKPTEPKLDWVIVGGESGPGHRVLNLDYARSLRDQCRAAGVSYFFKQVGGLRPDSGGDQLDGERIQEMLRAA